ncbi:MAG TPA: hypothetical protein PLD27_04620 [bacterium]|nr:hypothetical protein [bacterium]HOL46814.1 hypothetical protein [bacterium]HPQ18660.1 hypothetical protein [bacterium]
MPSILPAGDAVYTYTYLIELNKIFYEYEIKGRVEKPAPKNITKPRTREEVKLLLHKQLTVLNKTLFLFEDVNKYLDTSESELDNLYNDLQELNEIYLNYNSLTDEEAKKELEKKFELQKKKIIKLFIESNYDDVPVFKFEKIEEKQEKEKNKLIIKKREFKKTFTPKLNKFIEEGKRVVFTGLTDEPFFRLPIPAEISYKEKDILALKLSEQEKVGKFINELNEVYLNHIEYIKGYNEKIITLKRNINKSIEDINFTRKELENIKEAENIEEVKSSITYNNFFPVVEKGMLYNFIA